MVPFSVVRMLQAVAVEAGAGAGVRAQGYGGSLRRTAAWTGERWLSPRGWRAPGQDIRVRGWRGVAAPCPAAQGSRCPRRGVSDSLCMSRVHCQAAALSGRSRGPRTVLQANPCEQTVLRHETRVGQIDCDRARRNRWAAAAGAPTGPAALPCDIAWPPVYYGGERGPPEDGSRARAAGCDGDDDLPQWVGAERPAGMQSGGSVAGRRPIFLQGFPFTALIKRCGGARVQSNYS